LPGPFLLCQQLQLERLVPVADEPAGPDVQPGGLDRGAPLLVAFPARRPGHRPPWMGEAEDVRFAAGHDNVRMVAESAVVLAAAGDVQNVAGRLPAFQIGGAEDVLSPPRYLATWIRCTEFSSASNSPYGMTLISVQPDSGGTSEWTMYLESRLHLSGRTESPPKAAPTLAIVLVAAVEEHHEGMGRHLGAPENRKRHRRSAPFTCGFAPHAHCRRLRKGQQSTMMILTDLICFVVAEE